MIPQGFSYHTGYLDVARQKRILTAVRAVVAHSPFYTPTMPRSGKPLSVRMTNCGPLGWLTDKDGGYRYQPTHPTTGVPWLPIPAEILDVWRELAGYPRMPEACLINYYAGSSRLGSHIDSDESDTAAPVVSLSLGDDAVFHLAGTRRTDPKHRFTLRSGDVVVLGGASRLAYHGVDKILAGTSDLLAEGGRINLTLRRVTLPA
ncbi:MAG: alpha-ketoglutarate-dependent dioxygenase AlkB [Hyphomicrobiaceae bacterium]